MPGTLPHTQNKSSDHLASPSVGLPAFIKNSSTFTWSSVRTAASGEMHRNEQSGQMRVIVLVHAPSKHINSWHNVYFHGRIESIAEE